MGVGTEDRGATEQLQFPWSAEELLAQALILFHPEHAN